MQRTKTIDKLWPVIGVLVGTVISGLINYGILKEKMNNLDDKIRDLKQEVRDGMKDRITREEYQGRHSDLLDRIRTKGDL